MSRVSRILMAAAAVLALSAVTAQAAQHLNAYALQSDFMCVSCHEPLNQVNSPESQAEKSTLQQLVDKGLTLSQIKTQMVNDYGEDVLAKPPANGINLLVYILPPLVLIGGLALLAYNLPRWRRRARVQNAAVAGHAGPPQDPAEVDRLNEELSRFDG